MSEKEVQKPQQDIGLEQQNMKYIVEPIINNPEEYIDEETFARTIYTPGGGLPMLFGEANPVWEGLKQKSPDGKHVSIASVDFSLDELSVMGDFYRWLESQKSFQAAHCIDERLDLAHSDMGMHTHDECGAANAVSASSGLALDAVITAVRERYLQETRSMQIYNDMPDHETLLIYMNLSKEGRGCKAGETRGAQTAESLTVYDLHSSRSDQRLCIF